MQSGWFKYRLSHVVLGDIALSIKYMKSVIQQHYFAVIWPIQPVSSLCVITMLLQKTNTYPTFTVLLLAEVLNVVCSFILFSAMYNIEQKTKHLCHVV